MHLYKVIAGCIAEHASKCAVTLKIVRIDIMSFHGGCMSFLRALAEESSSKFLIRNTEGSIIIFCLDPDLASFQLVYAISTAASISN